MVTGHLARRTAARIVRAASWRVEAILRTDHERRVAEWRSTDAQGTLRLDYPLDDRSVVIDAGGYKGQWTSDIFSMYRCTIHVYEPVPLFAQRLEQRFLLNPSIHVHREGLGASTRQDTIFLQADGSSTIPSARLGQAKGVLVGIRSITDVIDELDVSRIGLLKLNIEGGEFEVLECLIEQGYADRIDNLQVQFHAFVENAATRRKAIQDRLRLTHQLSYCIPFVWENWALRRTTPSDPTAPTSAGNTSKSDEMLGDAKQVNLGMD